MRPAPGSAPALASAGAARGRRPSSDSLARRQHAQNAQAFAPVGAGVAPVATQSRKCRHSNSSGSPSSSAIGSRIGRARHRHRLAPVDAVRIEQQLLLPRQPVIEHGHRAVADDDQLLFLERMQPGHEDMRLLAAGKRQMRRRHVGDRLVQIIGPGCADLDRLLADQRQDHREIVRRKGPEDVFLAPNLPEIQPVGIDILQPPERARRAPGRAIR